MLSEAQIQEAVKSYVARAGGGLLTIVIVVLGLPLAIVLSPFVGIGYGVERLIDWYNDKADGVETVRR